MARRRVYQVSKIASCIGINPYEETCDALESIWIKENKASYYTAVNACKPAESLASKRKTLWQALKSDEATSLKQIQHSNAPVHEKVTHIEAVPQGTLTAAEHTELVKHLKSNVSTSHGVARESSAMDIYIEHSGESVKRGGALITHTHKDQFNIRGKVDGLTDQNKIVEIKNRTRRFFHQVVGYEYCQVQFYMMMHNSTRCDLVECFHGAIQTHPIEYDAEYTQIALEKLERFDNILSFLQNDTCAQHEYFNAPSRNNYILNSLT